MASTQSSVGEEIKTKVFDFGGFITKDQEEFEIAEGSIIGGQNMALEKPLGSDAKSVLTVRKGFTLKNPVSFSTSKCQGGYIYKQRGQNTYICFVVSGGILFYASFLNASDTLTFTQFPSNEVTFSYTGQTYFNNANPVQMVQFQDMLFIVDGSNRCRYYIPKNTNVIPNTAESLNELILPDDARPSLVVLHKNRLVFNSTTALYQNNIYMSQLNNPLGYVLPNGVPPGDAVVQPFSGYPDEKSSINAIGAFQNCLLVMQDRRVFLWETYGAPYNADGSITWNIKELAVEYGALNQNGMADLGEKVMYMTSRGVHEMTGIQAMQGATNFTLDSINAVPLSGDIEPTLFQTDYSDVSAIYYKFYYIMCVKSAGVNYNNTALVYDVRRKAWFTPWSNFNFSRMIEANVNGQLVCYAFSSTSGQVYTLFTQDDDAGTAIPANFIMWADDMRIPGTRMPNTKNSLMRIQDRTKTFRRCNFWFRNDTANGLYFSHSIDNGPFDYCPVGFTSQGAGAVPLGKFLLGGSKLGEGFTYNNPRIFKFSGRRGRQIKLQWANNNNGVGNNGRFSFYGYTLKAYLEDEENRNLE